MQLQRQRPLSVPSLMSGVWNGTTANNIQYFQDGISQGTDPYNPGSVGDNGNTLHWYRLRHRRTVLFLRRYRRNNSLQYWFNRCERQQGEFLSRYKTWNHLKYELCQYHWSNDLCHSSTLQFKYYRHRPGR